MSNSKSKLILALVFLVSLPSAHAWAHWCDDMWISAYNIVVRPDSDTSPKALYVQNNMGYQLPSFKIAATSSSGGAITLTPPTTLKVPNTLLPGEQGIWKITAGSPAKIEDLTFSIGFGDDVPGWTNQDSCYPLVGAKPVMVVKKDGSLYPPTPAGLDSPKAPGSPCVGIVALGRSLIDEAITDFEDVNVGLDHLLQYYCSGRSSWGIDDNVTKTYCKDTSNTTCPTSKSSGVGRVSDYVHLWAAGELAIRKSALGARLAVFRERLKCAVNDGDMGFSGFPLFILGYLGDDAGAKSFLQTKASAGGELGSIAKAALYMMGDTAQKADVQAGLQSSSVFVKAACAAALGIADKDDAPVTSTLIPLVKWANPAEASEDGKGMYAAHILEIVAFDRRGWVVKGVGTGSVTFYGETSSGAGGSSGTGGTSGTGGGPGSLGGTSGATTGAGGGVGPSGSGGTSSTRSATGGAVATGGSPGTGGSVSVGAGGRTPGSGGKGGSGDGGDHATGGSAGAGGSNDRGGSPSTNGGAGGDTTNTATPPDGSDCKCNLGGRQRFPAMAALGLAMLLLRRRRQPRAHDSSQSHS